MNRRELLALLSLPCFAGAVSNLPQRLSDTPWLQGASNALASWIDNPKLQLQLAYTPVHSGVVQPTVYFRKDEFWFAAASLVKLPLAIFVLEAMQAMRLDFSQAQIAFPDMPDCAVNAAELRKPQPLLRVLERALVISDDSAYCALFDFLGAQAIANRFAQMGDTDVRIQARFGNCGAQASRVSPGMVITDFRGNKLYERGALPGFAIRRSTKPIFVGRAWMADGKRIDSAKDFSDSNTLPLAVAHRLLLTLRYPQAVDPSQRFTISNEARSYLLSRLAMSPHQAGYLSAKEKAQAAHAFRLLGAGDARWPKGLQIHSKVGWAFGFLSDVAHLKDAQNECFLSAACYLNADGVLNDGAYEYDSIGRPLMGELGRLLLRNSASANAPMPRA